MKPVFTFKLLSVGLILLLAQVSFAQLITPDVFLQGHYVEVGIGQLGWFGSENAPPASYHPHLNYTPADGLGFVADPHMTGWSTNTVSPTSHYYGDYFYPGSYFEGWELQVGGKRCQAFHIGITPSFTYGGGMGTCTGSNVSYSDSNGIIKGVWQGTVDSITLKQTTILDTNNFYFIVHIDLINNAVTPKNDLYYMRMVDPDNDETWVGVSGFATNNIIEHQMPDTFNRSVVSATGSTIPSAYLALGSPDTASRAFISQLWPISSSIDLGTVYNETYSADTFVFYQDSIAHNSDISVGLIFHIPHLATVDSAAYNVYRTTGSIGVLHPSNTASLDYFYVFTSNTIDSAIKTIKSFYIHADSLLAVNSQGSRTAINVYPNPAHNTINITGLNVTDHILLYDMAGKNTNQKWQIKKREINTYLLDDIAPGNYILKITDDAGHTRASVPLRKAN